MTELLSLPGFPIRKSVYHRLFAPTHSLSQLVTSFVGSWCQGIHPTLLVAWPFRSIIYWSSIWIASKCFYLYRQRLRLSIKTIHYFPVMYYPNFNFLLDFSNVFSFFTRLSLFSFQGTIFEFFSRSSHILYIGSPSLRTPWWAWMESNHRPHAYQACALTVWATSPWLFPVSYLAQEN